MFLVLIETSGNQNYIFSTNKLKENIGASELTYRAGTAWIVQAIDEVRGASGGEKRDGGSIDNRDLRKKLLDQDNWNKRIDPDDELGIEVIVATSGKALILTKKPETAQQIIESVTLKAIESAPGMDITGVISKNFDWGNSLGQVIGEVHRKLEEIRSQRPSLNLRALRLPIVDDCSVSGLPASRVEIDAEGNKVSLSATSSEKQKNGEQFIKRIEKLLDDNYKLFPNVNKLQKELEDLEWLSVIHADGNGLGEIFLQFDKHIEKLPSSETGDNSKDRNYVERLRKFSIALDICTENAFLNSLKVIFPQSQDSKHKFIPIVPLVLGGDDLTVICEGKLALKFTETFLKEFEEETARNDHDLVKGIIGEIAKKALGVNRLSACAGIAIIKPHFPFSVAYSLAEDLMKSAKVVKKKITVITHEGTKKPYPCSALDFHIVYDSTDVALKSVRDKLKIEEKTLLYTRPYIVTEIEKIPEETDRKWADFYHWKHLEHKVDILLSKDEDGKRKLPNSQIHSLREGLFLGEEAANAKYELIYDRYKDFGLSEMMGENLFEQEPENSNHTTRLIDIIDAADFINPGSNNAKTK